MAYLSFFLATVAACLLWTAAFTAAAARVRKFGWLLRIVALGIPLLAWVPWLSITAWLAFVRSSSNNWFGPTVTAFLSTLIGGLLIATSGRSLGTSMPVVHWPIPWLAIGFGGAVLAAWMAMAALERDLERWASDLRAEVNGMVASVVPPPPPPRCERRLALPGGHMAFQNSLRHPHRRVHAAVWGQSASCCERRSGRCAQAPGPTHRSDSTRH